MVDCMTDNRNRTVAEVRHAFSKFGGNLGTDGSVAYLFSKCGLLIFSPDAGEDTVMEAAIEAGAEDVLANDDGSMEVICSPDDFLDVKAAMATAGLKPDSAEVTMRAATNNTLDLDAAKTMVNLIDMLEDLDDVQNVYSNAEISDEILAQIN